MNSQNTNLEVVYTTEKGVKFYAFKDPLAIGAIRGLSAEKARRFVDMNITERSLKELVKHIKKVAGAGDLVEAFAGIQEIDYRLNFISEESSVLDLACIYFFLEDEDPEIPTDAKNREKHAIFETDLKAKGFFLKIGIAITNKFSKQLEQDLPDYFEKNRAMSERIRRYIVEESSLNSTSISTS